jgi:hypothetical protein
MGLAATADSTSEWRELGAQVTASVIRVRYGTTSDHSSSLTSDG